MNLKMVTWDGDLTQFLVDAETRLEAIKKAVKANLRLEIDEEFEVDIHDLTTYSVYDLDFELLAEIFTRKDCNGMIEEAIVFNY